MAHVMATVEATEWLHMYASAHMYYYHYMCIRHAPPSTQEQEKGIFPPQGCVLCIMHSRGGRLVVVGLGLVDRGRIVIIYSRFYKSRRTRIFLPHVYTYYIKNPRILANARQRLSPRKHWASPQRT
jgi:hypothetical protein